MRGYGHLTLQLLWEEYRQTNPEGYRYSRFCELYQRWRSKLDVVLRQEHKAGEKMFVDWAGSTIPVSGSISMAAGEYVSVHSQADTEKADLKLERAELKNDDEGEHGELMAIYVARGLDPALARQVAAQLMAHDALEAHARDELGISAALQARPIQAALASAGSFVAGALMPLAVTAVAPEAHLIPIVALTSLLFLAFLGGLAAQAGGAGVTIGALRVTFWGALAMIVTAGVGALFGTATTGA